MTQAITLLFLIAILVSLGFALVSLLSAREDARRTTRALTWRIGLSVLLIALLFIGYLTGYVHPHDLGQ